VIFAHQNSISNWLTCLVQAKSTGELISFGFSERSVRSLVSANHSAISWDQTKKLHFLADLWSQSEFRTQWYSQWKTGQKSKTTQCSTGWVVHHTADRPSFSLNLSALPHRLTAVSISGSRVHATTIPSVTSPSTACTSHHRQQL